MEIGLCPSSFLLSSKTIYRISLCELDSVGLRSKDETFFFFPFFLSLSPFFRKVFFFFAALHRIVSFNPLLFVSVEEQ